MNLAVLAFVSLWGFLPAPLEFCLDEAEISFQQSGSQEYLFIPGGASPFPEGEPAIPGFGYSMVLPPGSELTGVEVEVLEEVILPGTHSIAPVMAVPFGNHIPSPASYGAFQGSYPASRVNDVNTGRKTGFRVGSFTFVPFSWNADTGELSVVTRAVLSPVIETVLTDDGAFSSYQIAVASRALERVVSNPEMIADCSPPVAYRTGTPWVAIADSALQEVLQPLVDHRNTTHGASFVTTQWIYENYSGRDTQERIRNYLKDAYENQDLVYALIVGDFGETTRLSSLNISGTVMNATTDLYYCDLDGSWDLDGDGLFGELNDGLDYYSDIYCGRFSSDIPSRIATMVGKTIAYETDSPPGDWRTTALLAGAGLWVDDPPGYWGSFVCDSIDTRIPEDWTVHKLYEDYSSHPNDQIDLYNQGVAYSSLNGHGNEAGVWWMFGPTTEIVANSNYYGMSNDGMPVVFHSMACHPGHLQNVACIAERLMFWPNGGAIAVMFNSHWGIGTPPGFGPSEWLELFFAEVLIQDQEYELGVAHGASKDLFKASVSITHQNWILQENNFLGDPATRFAPGQMGIESPDGPSGRPVLLSVSPNPSPGQCAVEFQLPEPSSASIGVYDMTGRMVVSICNGDLPAGRGSVQADLSGFPSGCYRVVMNGCGGMDSAPVLVLR